MNAHRRISRQDDGERVEAHQYSEAAHARTLAHKDALREIARRLEVERQCKDRLETFLMRHGYDDASAIIGTLVQDLETAVGRMKAGIEKLPDPNTDTADPHRLADIHAYQRRAL